jgi:hypothetical protein
VHRPIGQEKWYPLKGGILFQVENVLGTTIRGRTIETGGKGGINLVFEGCFLQFYLDPSVTSYERI